VYFDYETSWSQKLSLENDVDESQFEHELHPEDLKPLSLNNN
jgi:hypothetical protein